MLLEAVTAQDYVTAGVALSFARVKLWPAPSTKALSYQHVYAN